MAKYALMVLVAVGTEAFDWGLLKPKAQATGCTKDTCWNQGRKFCSIKTHTCRPCHECTALTGLGGGRGLCGTNIRNTWAQSRFNGRYGISALSKKIKPPAPNGNVIPASFICVFKQKGKLWRRRLVSDEKGRRLIDGAIPDLMQQLFSRAFDTPFGVAAQSADDRVEVASVSQGRSFITMEASPKALQIAADNENVEFCEPDSVVTADSFQIGAPWGLDRVDQRAGGLNGLYDTGAADGEGVDVYVVDTGVNKQHSDFSSRLKGGYNAVMNSDGTQDPTDWDDCNGHGTHCAGSSVGSVHGVAKKATLYGVRVLGTPTDRCGKSGAWSSVLMGFNHVIEQAITGQSKGRPVIMSASIGGGKSSAINAVISEMKQVGVLPVVAAGNSASDACNDSPGGSPDAFTVGATDEQDKLWKWNEEAGSNWGTCVDILAPGVNIRSAWHSTQYGTMLQTGTSMATPHVSGAAALVAGQLMQRTGFTKPTPSELEAELLARATAGVIDVKSAPTTPNLMLFTSYDQPRSDYFDREPNVDVTTLERRLRGVHVGTPEGHKPRT